MEPQEPPEAAPKRSRVSTQAPELLKKVSLFSALDDQELSGLASHMRRRTLRKDTIVFHKDQAGDALYLIESGHVRIFLPTEAGGELIVEIARSGDVFGELALLDGRPRSASAETIEDTSLYVLSRDDFQRFVSATPQFATSLIALLSTRIRQVTEYAESMAFLDIHGRVARALLQLAERHGTRTDHGTEIAFDMTQSELASMIGATRERVNRALTSFRSQGLIEFRGKKIVLLDPARLKQRIY
jgi:CRP/FNR family cyclic AMP-dependent transcriptional regulator